MTIDNLKKFIDEFENEADDEWNLDPQNADHFIYWMQQKKGMIIRNFGHITSLVITDKDVYGQTHDK